MAKQKVDFVSFLLKHGDRLGIALAGSFTLLLLILGVWTLFDVPNANEKREALAKGASELRQKAEVNQTARNELKPTEAKIGDFIATDKPSIAVPESKFTAGNPLFDVTAKENDKRRNPIVLGPTEADLTLTRANVLVYDFQKGEKGTTVAVVKETEITNSQLRKDLKDAQGKNIRKRLNTLPPLQQFSGMPGMPGMPGGGPMGPAVGPGSGPGTRPGSGPALPPGYPGGAGRGLVGMPGMAGAAYDANTKDLALTYVPVDKVKGDELLANLVLPVRMVVVTANFPYKQQLEEYAKALRYNGIDEMFAASGGSPLAFKGFDVERQVKDTFTGEVVEKWTLYDLKKYYGPLVSRAVDFEAEDPALQPILTSRQDRLLLPLPKLARGTYPPVTLASVKKSAADVAERLAEKNPQGLTALGAKARGEVDVFGEPVEKTSDTPATPAEAAKVAAADIPEFTMIRFVDIAVNPGFTYEYRLRVRVANPNYGDTKEAKERVVRPSMAEKKELEGPWVTIGTAAPVSEEAALYAVEAAAASGSKEKAKVELHRWMESVKLAAGDTRGEPVGDWVVTTIDVQPGEYIGNRSEIRLPIWSPTHLAYLMRELIPTKKGKIPPKEKGGVSVDFRTQSLLVDMDGGSYKDYRMPGVPGQPAPKPITESAAAEVLVITADGRLQAYSSAKASQDKERTERKTTFEKWLADVQTASNKLGPATGEDLFNPKPK